jgi:hypothetical protein
MHSPYFGQSSSDEAELAIKKSGYRCYRSEIHSGAPQSLVVFAKWCCLSVSGATAYECEVRQIFCVAERQLRTTWGSTISSAAVTNDSRYCFPDGFMG